MCTHLLPDVERTADYVVVISQGKQVVQGDLQTLLAKKGESVTLRIQVSDQTKSYFKVLQNNGFEVNLETETEILCFLKNHPENGYIEFFKLAKEIGVNIRLLTANRISLEDIFLDVVHEEGYN